MTTKTLKVKEKSKKGRMFLDLAKMFYDEKNEVELMKIPIKKSKVATNLTIEDKKYLDNLKKVVVEIKSGNHKNYKTWEEFANEV